MVACCRPERTDGKGDRYPTSVLKLTTNEVEGRHWHCPFVRIVFGYSWYAVPPAVAVLQAVHPVMFTVWNGAPMRYLENATTSSI